MDRLADRVALAKLPFGLRRKAVMQWAKLIEREAEATGESVLLTLRAHHAMLDEKTGVSVGVTGFLGAAVALLVQPVAAQSPIVVGVFAVFVLVTFNSGVYALNALSPAGAGDHAAEDLEVARLLRLARRAEYHAAGLVVARIAAFLLSVLIGMMIGVAIDVDPGS